MKKFLITTAFLALASSAFAAEPAKTVGQAPPAAGASSFYLAQDTAS
jgi:opacity protein-like surface antigen